ncbi:MAG: hypothetical protein OEZ04_05030 [Nitrospinota bacterium]|nr:hypothetical protein [Nitrospinota bacterium]
MLNNRMLLPLLTAFFILLFDNHAMGGCTNESNYKEQAGKLKQLVSRFNSDVSNDALPGVRFYRILLLFTDVYYYDVCKEKLDKSPFRDIIKDDVNNCGNNQMVSFEYKESTYIFLYCVEQEPFTVISAYSIKGDHIIVLQKTKK